MYILLSLGCLMLITVFNLVLMGSGQMSFIVQSNTNYLDAIIGFEFIIDDFWFALGIVIALIGIGCVIGISIFGSGINSESVRIIMIIIAYISLWVFLSILSIDLILNIAIFGVLIYILLTMFYTVGVIKKLN